MFPMPMYAIIYILQQDNYIQTQYFCVVIRSAGGSLVNRISAFINWD